MGGEGSGVSQPFVDPKGQNVTFQGTSLKSSNSETENPPSSDPTTPSIINSSNVRFTYRPGTEDDDDIEEDEDNYIPSPKPNIPKGHVNDKKSKFERQNNAKNAKDAKELAKQNRNARKRSNLPGPSNKKNEKPKKEEDENPKKDDANTVTEEEKPKTENKDTNEESAIMRLLTKMDKRMENIESDIKTI